MKMEETAGGRAGAAGAVRPLPADAKLSGGGAEERVTLMEQAELRDWLGCGPFEPADVY